MTDEQFEEFLSLAMTELRAKQEQLETEYGFGSYARWHFDQRSQKLELFDSADVKVVEADVVDIGSYAANSDSWKWGWANESVLPELRRKAERLKELKDVTGVDLFASESAFAVEGEPMAWELAAFSVQHLGALGVYRAPSSSKPLFTFLAITEVRRYAA